MKVKILGILGVLFLVAALVVGLAGVALAESTQIWYLNDTNTDPTPPTGATYNMWKEDTTKGSTGYVNITSGSSMEWAANEAATVNVGFGRATWAGTVVLNSAISEYQIVTLTLGYIDGDGWHTIKSQDWGSGGTETEIPISILPDSAFTVNSGHYLAFKIANASGNDTLQVKIKDQSHLDSPGTDPGYPIPELPTIVLLGTGLVCLAGYFGLKRRKRAYLKA